jgi:hypothetical protein
MTQSDPGRLHFESFWLQISAVPQGVRPATRLHS